MATSRIGRTPLGAMYRSPLGVRARIGRQWRIIVSIEPGFGVNVDELAVQQRFEQFRDDLINQGKKVSLVFRKDWLSAATEPLESGTKRVANLVFIIGGGNPGKFTYFQNYSVAANGPLEIKDGGEGAVLDFSSQLDTWVAVPGSPLSECQFRSRSMTTNYDVSFEQVSTEDFDDDLAGFDAKKGDFAENKTYLFFDPLDIPEYVQGLDVLYREEWHQKVNPNTIVNQTGVLEAVSVRWYCREFREDGAIREFYYIFLPIYAPATGTYWGTPIFHGKTGVTEGVDRSNDSLSVTEAILEEMIEDNGPEERKYAWGYRGVVEWESLNADEIISSLKSE